MTNTTTDVAIIMGSDSDLPVVEVAFPILESFGVNFTKNVLSAHRTPHDVIEFIKLSESNYVVWYLLQPLEWRLIWLER